MEPLSTVELADYRNSGNLSEFDSLSDSDWLDIASNRESDDNDSISSRDSDQNGEVSSAPHSRRSSISIGSSRDDEVDAWEGFASDASDVEGPLSSPAVGLNSDGQATDQSTGLFDTDPVEDRRVRHALDQSMISTLSGSRTNSYPSTVQNSIRDLKLSFPDPITSSRDELHRSYEDVSATEDGSISATDIEESDVPVRESPTPAEEVPPAPLPSLNIVLYGRASSVKWTFAHDLLRMASMEKSGSSGDGRTQWFTPKGDTDGDVYAVHDMTEHPSETFTLPSPRISSDRPSLAIVYLPLSRITLPDHTFYLPVIVQGAAEGSQGVEGWNLLAVSTDQILPVREDSFSPISAKDAVTQLEASRVQSAFKRLMAPPAPPAQAPEAPAKKNGNVLAALALERFSSVHAVTIFALVSIIAGFVFNASFRAVPPLATPTATPPAPSTTAIAGNNLWGLFGTNHSNSTGIVVRTTTSVSIIPAANQRGRGVISMAEPGSSNGQTFAERLKASTDVIIRPAATLSDTPSPKVATQASKLGSTIGSQPTTDSSTSTSLSLRLVDSLSEIVESTTKALLNKDSQDLTEALDELMQSIRKQADVVAEESKVAVQMLREQLAYRNGRAKGKARMLKSKSDKFLGYAKEQLKDRTGVAKKRAEGLKESAQILKESAKNSEVWRTYAKVQKEWASNLKKGDRDKHEHEHMPVKRRCRKGRKACRKARANTGFFTRF